MNKLKVKKGDNVIVITGKDKGKTGEIITVFRDKSRSELEAGTFILTILFLGMCNVHSGKEYLLIKRNIN